ncbi:MAG: AraC family transcriptional regulator [Opitutaceae bacterium]|jgi:AraC-like DNA-binding protein|nr:AraC family transcriptional regulator [Opitutaceae bacterium]
MKHLPEIRDVRHNRVPFNQSSFIDEEWIWHYIIKGECTFEMGGRVWGVSVGDSVLLPPRQLHIVRPVNGGPLLQDVVHFILPELYAGADFSPVLTLQPKARKPIRMWFDHIIRIWQQLPLDTLPSANQQIEMGGLMAAILGLCLQNEQHARPSEKTSATGWPEVSNAVQFLQENHVRPDLALGEISKAAGVTPNYLCRIFKNHMGRSVISYLTEYRLKEAEKLLLRTTTNCSQIADQIGFPDLHTFSRVFRQKRRISPTDFRMLHAPRISP